MIEFHLNTASGVSPYLQLVQQVRRALLLGLLAEGDQLPTVKDVVAHLAINPNTVLKAYRELEHSGLVAARAGVGTFVTSTLSDASLAAHGPLRQELERWFGKARRAGLDDESIEALFQDTFRSLTSRVSHDRRPRRHRARQAVPPTVGVARLHVAGTGRSRRRPRRTKRCRQDDAAAPRGRPAATECRADRRSRAASPPRVRRNSAGSVSSRRTRPSTALSRWPSTCKLGGWLNPKLGRRSRRTPHRPARPRSQAARGQALRRPARPVGAHPRDRETTRAARYSTNR